MNKIVKTTTSGGFTNLSDDIRFTQDEIIEDIETKLATINNAGNCIFSGGGYIVSGAVFTAYSGVYSYGGILYQTSNYFSGYTGDINNVWVVSDTTYDSSGDRTFKDGSSIVDIYELNKCKYVYDTGTPTGYNWKKKLVDFKPISYFFATSISKSTYTRYELYKTWIDVLFDTDINSAYAFDKLLENDTRTQYNIDLILANQTLREYFMDKLITNTSDRDYMVNLIKDSLKKEFTTFTYINNYLTNSSQPLILTKDVFGYVHIFGTFYGHIGSGTHVSFIDSLPAAYIPSNTVYGTIHSINLSTNNFYSMEVTSGGVLQFQNAPGTDTTAYHLDITYKV